MTKAEELISAWVDINNVIKNSRLTKGLSYNESIIMLLLYKRYLQDNEGLVSIKEIVLATNMLKSLVNRTINSLEAKGMCERSENAEDKRSVYIRPIPEKLDLFLKVHFNSVSIAEKIVEIIGEEDAEHFIRIINKVNANKEKLI